MSSDHAGSCAACIAHNAAMREDPSHLAVGAECAKLELEFVLLAISLLRFRSYPRDFIGVKEVLPFLSRDVGPRRIEIVNRRELLVPKPPPLEDVPREHGGAGRFQS